MHWIRGFSSLLWRLWFIVINIVLVPFCGGISIPFLFKEKYYPLAYRLHRLWGVGNLSLMGIVYKVKKETRLSKDQPYIVLSNHTSVMDIMLLYALVSRHAMVFIGKSELSKIPVFGYVYRKSNILVDRKSRISGTHALKEAKIKIDLGRSICIFPEGGVPKTSNMLAHFKGGAFALAIEKQIPLLLFSVYGMKQRFPYNFFRGGPGKVYVRRHAPISTKGMTLSDKDALKEKCYRIIENQLKDFARKNRDVGF
ncbi:lysophospholipid acyltransferase family protein [Bacteroidetes bacterium endosymbiont of Geopemphigus sp.]|uniref:lysophospholipid acyltransferase family protein n=1 Tax=Bacteroidetes bacterium endosymbiont of Geopemphigus sp. TaxID=2047937 RepID=UPI000CD0ABE6|nr:lysophospholipid acyltransferase family protein [Bacteroidetes bacterium endosymbiont of Geopemphigus sp.]